MARTIVVAIQLTKPVDRFLASPAVTPDRILQENGDDLLLESGDNILLE